MINTLNSSCPCGSGLETGTCCQPSLQHIGLDVVGELEGTYLFDWMEKFSSPISEAFNQKARTFGYRISRYLDEVIESYLGLGYPSYVGSTGDIDEIFCCQKHHIAMTITAAYRLLAEGMFIQSGILLRTAVESSLVLLETAENVTCISLIEQNKYKSQSVLKRVKDKVPPTVVAWYGYFSANFTHSASLHQSAYLPRACYPENWIIVTGLQNIVRTVATYHILLERSYLDWVLEPIYWESANGSITFQQDNKVFKWLDALGLEVAAKLPCNAYPSQMERSPRSTTLKI